MNNIKDKRIIITGAAVFLASFIVYILTLCPTVPYRDSGELITAAYVLGNAHPPGFPLYLITGKLCSLIPISNIAWRLNMMSALFSSLTVVMVFMIMLKISGKKNMLISSAVSLVLAFSRVFWSQSVQAEVFALNCFLLALLVYIIIGLRANPNKTLYMFSFIFALSMCNHHSIILIIPPVLFYLWSWLREKDNVRAVSIDIVGCVFFIILGLALYLYLPVRAGHNPPLNWNNPDTLKKMISVFLRRDYGTLTLNQELVVVRSADLIIRQQAEFLGSMIRQFTLPLFLAGLIGLVALFKKNRKLWIFLLMIFLLGGPLFVFIANMPLDDNSRAIIERFFGIPAMVFSIWVGYGLMTLGGKLNKKGATPALCAIAILIPLVFNFRPANMSRNHFTSDYGENILSSIPMNALFFVRRDNSRNVLWYKQLVEKKRPDIRMVVVPLSAWWTEHMKNSWPQVVLRINEFNEADVSAMIKDNYAELPLYSDNLKDENLGKFYDYWLPAGIVFKFIPGKRESVGLKEVMESEQLLSGYTYRGEYDMSKHSDTFTREIIHCYAESYFNFGVIYHNRQLYAQGRDAFARALEIDPDYEDARRIYNIDKEMARKQNKK